VPVGSFVFVLSDFTAPFRPEAWVRAVGHGWDVVPVIVQDPVWEQSFPRVDGVLAPFADARRSRLRFVRLDEREVQERQRANEARLASLREDFSRLGLDPILLGSSDPSDVRIAFLEWAEARLELRGQ